MENKKELIFQDKKAIEYLTTQSERILQVLNDNYQKMKAIDSCLSHATVIAATFYHPNRRWQDKEQQEFVDSIAAVIKQQATFAPSDMISSYIKKDICSKLYNNEYINNVYEIDNTECENNKKKNIQTLKHNEDNDYIITFVTYNSSKDKFEISKNFKNAVIEKYTYYTQNNNQAKKYQALIDIEKIFKDNEITTQDISYIFYSDEKHIDKDYDLVKWLYQY